MKLITKIIQILNRYLLDLRWPTHYLSISAFKYFNISLNPRLNLYKYLMYTYMGILKI